jgi:hypothetical protein
MSALDSARRRVRKSLTAVTAMLCAFEGLEAPLGFASELERSIEVRRVYARLRKSIGEGEEPSDEELRARLRGVGTQVAMLIGRTIYPELRVDDRFQIRTLQQRILEWLREYDGSERANLTGRRLWQDVAGFARVLGTVNQRQELLEHDARVVAIANGTLFGRSPRAEVPGGLLGRLEALVGLDEELDALIEEKSTEAEKWRAPITRLARRFGKGRGAPPAAGTDPASIPWGDTP